VAPWSRSCADCRQRLTPVGDDGLRPPVRPSGPRWRRLAAEVRARREVCCRCQQPIDLTLEWSRRGQLLRRPLPAAVEPAPREGRGPGNLHAAHLGCNRSAGNQAPSPPSAGHPRRGDRGSRHSPRNPPRRVWLSVDVSHTFARPTTDGATRWDQTAHHWHPQGGRLCGRCCGAARQTTVRPAHGLGWAACCFRATLGRPSEQW
jgi:hypothetical protein